jgi:hypothetical protein
MSNRDGYIPCWITFLVVFALFCGAITAFFVLPNHGDHVDCLRLHEQTGLATKYARSGPSGECYVQVEDGRWVPEDRWMNMRDGS